MRTRRLMWTEKLNQPRCCVTDILFDGDKDNQWRRQQVRHNYDALFAYQVDARRCQWDWDLWYISWTFLNRFLLKPGYETTNMTGFWQFWQTHCHWLSLSSSIRVSRTPMELIIVFPFFRYKSKPWKFNLPIVKPGAVTAVKIFA